MWLVTFKQAFDLGCSLSSQNQMTPDWNEVIKIERSTEVKLMVNSVICITNLVGQLRVNFGDCVQVWEGFAEACKALVDQYLKYLLEFKEASMEMQSGTKAFKSPFVCTQLLRYIFFLDILSGF